MKEIISRRYKRNYLIMLAVSVITIFTSIRFMKLPIIQLVSIPMIAICALGAVVWTILLIDQRGVIEKIGNEVTIRQGIQKTVVKTTYIMNAYPTPHQTKAGVTQKNCVSVDVVIDGKRKTIICSDVEDVVQAVRRLNEITGIRLNETAD